MTCLDLNTLSPRELAERAGDELEGAPPLEVLRWAIDRFSPRFAITASMQDTVILHMSSRIDHDVPGRLPRHRLPLRGDHRHRRCRGAGLRPQPAAHPSAAHGRGAGRDLRQGPVRPRPRRLLPDAQGAARSSPRCAATTPTPRGSGATKATPAPLLASSSGTRSATRSRSTRWSPVAGRDRRVHRGQRRPGQPAADRRLRKRRLRPVHASRAAAATGAGPA